MLTSTIARCGKK